MSDEPWDKIFCIILHFPLTCQLEEDQGRYIERSHPSIQDGEYEQIDVVTDD